MTPPDSRISSFRPLSQAEVDLINKIKLHGKVIGELIAELRQFPASTPDPTGAGTLPFVSPAGLPTLDQRWISIGATHLQEGFMALTRAVAQPSHF